MSARPEQIGLGERLALQATIEHCLLGGMAPARPAEEGRLGELADIFGLSPMERDAIGLLWVLAFAPALRRDLVVLPQAGGCITTLLTCELFGHPLRARLPSEAASRLWRILSEQEWMDGNAALVLDPAVLAWLEGGSELDRELVGKARLSQASHPLPSWPVEHTAAQVRGGMRQGLRWRIQLLTRDLMAAEAFAVAVAERLSLPVLRVDADSLGGEEGRERAIRIHRQAFLDRLAPLLVEADAGRGPVETAPFPLQFAVATAPLPPLEGIRDLSVELPSPNEDERHRLWLKALPEASAWPRRQLDELARHEAELGEIIRVAASGPRDGMEAARKLRLAARDDVGGLAQRIDSGFCWDDLVLPAEVNERLRDIAFEAAERDRVWSAAEAKRLFPQGRGLAALFAGPPGTGKTMAAQVIAADLGLDLLRVDLSAVLSKWVGETAQHLQKILSARSSRRALLFFDEADALYGKRVEEVRDAQDRFANMDISHLMVALENYEGIVLLATNLKANIDPAFIRRIRHVVDFPRPDAKARQEIWSRVVAGLFGAERAAVLAEDLGRVARIESTGAQIKNTALSALFAARRAGTPPDASMLGRLLARELAKDGAGLSERDLETALEGRP